MFRAFFGSAKRSTDLVMELLVVLFFLFVFFRLTDLRGGLQDA